MPARRSDEILADPRAADTLVLAGRCGYDVSIGCAALWMVHRAIDDLESEELQQRVRSVRRFIESRPPGETRAQLRDAITAAYNVSHGNKWLQVIDEKGNWIYRSPHVAAAYPTLALPQQAPQNGRYFTLYCRVHLRPRSDRSHRSTWRSLHRANRLDSHQDHGRSLELPHSALCSHHYRPDRVFTGRLFHEPQGAQSYRRNRGRGASHQRPQPRHSPACPSAKDEISDLSRTLNQMLERIDKAFASVRTFTGNASHELRTPISLLRTEIEVALIRQREANEYRAILAVCMKRPCG